MDNVQTFEPKAGSRVVGESACMSIIARLYFNVYPDQGVRT
jgi:hypothetical protein